MASSIEDASDWVALTWTAVDTRTQHLPGLAKWGYVTKYVTNSRLKIKLLGGHKIGHSNSLVTHRRGDRAQTRQTPKQVESQSQQIPLFLWTRPNRTQRHAQCSNRA